MLFWQQGQLGAVDTAVLAAASGSPTVVVVQGDEGTGKTSFLDELADRATGFDVLDAGGFESAAEHSFGILEQWGAIDGMGSTPPASPFVGAKLLHQLLDRHADGGPVLLRLDDLQWADRESVEALTWMLQRASGDRLLVAMASRPMASTIHPAWQRWSSGRGRVMPIELAGLPLEDASRLVHDVRPDLNAATVQRLWEHTSGNPSYLAALLAEHDAADLVSRQWLPAPRAFADAIESRSRRLSEDALALARSIAVLGTERCSLADAGALASVAHPTDAAEELASEGLVEIRTPDTGPVVRITRPIVRSAIYEVIPPAERRALHTAAAGIVPRTDDVLGHRIAAVERYDDALAAEIDAWASYLHEVSLHRMSARYLRAAAWLSSNPRDRERRWLDSLFENLLAQDTSVVRAVYQKVEDAEDVMRRDLVLGTLATFEDDNHEAVYWFRKQLSDDETTSTADPLTHYRVEVLLAWSRVQGGAETTQIAAGLARARAIPATDPAVLGWQMAAEGLVAKRTQPVRDLLDQLVDLPENPAAVPWEARNRLGWRADLRADAGLMGPAIRDLEHVVSMVDEGGLEAALPHRHALLGLCHWFAGQWNKARLHLRLALDLGASESPVAAAIVPLLDIGDGELEEADRKIARAREILTPNPWIEACDRLDIALVARQHAADGDDAPRGAVYDGLRETVAQARTGELVKSAPWLAHAALAAIWAEEYADADACLALLTTSCDPGAPWIPAMAGWLRGLAAEVHGDHQVALDEIARAARDEHNDLPLYRAHMLLDQARVAAALGDRAQAERARQHATEIYDGLGATAYAARASAGLASGPSRPTAHGLPQALGLTDREQDVLTLVASGMSYAQIARELFVTQSTVGYHLSNIYRKAQVTSRHELTELVRRDPAGFGIVST